MARRDEAGDRTDLAADPRARACLTASTVWHEITHLAETGSTQDLALQQLRLGQRPGLVVVADAQTAGRGRAGRSWRDDVAGPGGPANLAVTATVTAPENNAGLAPLATGLAVAGAYRSAGAEPALKWPNDVLLGGRKAAGILVERHTLPDGPTVLLIGCGLDLDWRGVDRSGDAAGWTSLAEAIDAEVDRVQVLVDLLEQLGSRLAQLPVHPDEVLAAYRPLCATIGREVRVERPGGQILVGRASSIDASGRLILEVDRGREVVDVGDVFHIERV
ncbi:MAG: biotin--[acetyl-CoA-carboxylase] ligase [Intrasporangiaceae bacterium]|nr:biotin--[acetyl-CoA-carboxylase] ligase [Intrasporangiaceae bacterium]